jgi:hypothetical protein
MVFPPSIARPFFGSAFSQSPRLRLYRFREFAERKKMTANGPIADIRGIGPI